MNSAETMSERTHINDGFGNRIALLDEFGNLSVQVMMLYAEDRLTIEDRKLVDELVANDEMSRDALEGFMLTSNVSRTRTTINELNAAIQQKSGAKPVLKLQPQEKQQFEYRKIAAGLAALMAIAAATYFGAKLFNKDEMALNQPAEEQTATEQPQPAQEMETVPTTTLLDSVAEAPLEQDKTKTVVEPTLSEKPLAKQKDVEKPSGQTMVSEKKVEQPKPQQQQNLSAGASNSDEMASANERENEPVVSGSLADAQNETLTAVAPAEEPVMDMTMDEDQAQEAAESAVKEMEELSLAQKASSARKMETVEMSVEETANANANARFPGGDIKMYKFIERKKNYPEALRQQGISGTVKVTFDIETDGRVVNAKVVSSINGVLDEDALRVVRSMPKWAPSMQNGEPVRSSRTVNVKYGN